MARFIKQEEITEDRIVKERSWRVEFFTELQMDGLATWNDYPVVVHRELAELSDPSPAGGDVFYRGLHKPKNKVIPAKAGEPKTGTDGTDPSHYENPAPPYLPKIRFSLHDIINATNEDGSPQTIDIKDGDGNVLLSDFPMAYIPAVIISGIETMVDNAHELEMKRAIDRAVIEAREGIDS